MTELVIEIARSLVLSDSPAALVVQVLAWVTATVTVALMLACVGCVLAHFDRDDRKGRMSRALLVLAALVSLATGTLAAQSVGSPDSIPELRPRFERVFGSDTMQLSRELRQGSPAMGIATSPNGRWLVLTVEKAGTESLWLVPTAGGEPVRLTDGHSLDRFAQWLPNGEGILYTSRSVDDPGPLTTWLNRLPISPETGRPTGPPRRVALDPTLTFAVSPDGRYVAYNTHVDSPRFGGEGVLTQSLRIVPTTGGAARTIPKGMGIVLAIRWGPEGRFLYYLNWRDPQVPKADILRVPVEGGDPEPLSVWDGWVFLSPHAQYVYRSIPSTADSGNRYEIDTVEGRPLATFTLPDPFLPAGFGDGPGELLATRQESVNPLRIVPVAGGPIRLLNQAWSYDVPLSWSPDSREVLVSTELNGERIVMFAPVDGGPWRQVALPMNHLEGTWPRLSRDGGRILYLSAGRAEGEHGFWMYDIARDSAIQVDEGKIPSGTVGGRWSVRDASGDGGRFLYGLTRNGRDELMEVDARGSTRLLWSFPDRGAEPPTVTVYGDRIAFTRNAGHEGSLFVARVGEERERNVLTLPGELGVRGSNPPTWSPDGRTLGVWYGGSGDVEPGILLVEVSETGDLVGEPRVLRGKGIHSGYGLTWLPDGRHFLWADEGEEGPLDSDVWLVSTDPDTPPVCITSDLEGSVWSFTLSPDGRYIAVESEMLRGSSIWRVNLGKGTAGSGR